MSDITNIAMLLDAVSEAVVVYDSEFRFLEANAPAMHQMGVTREAVIGQTVWKLFPETVAPYHAPLARAMQERIPVTFHARYAPNDTWTEGRCVPINAWGEAREPALAVFFRDITQQKRAAERAESLQRVSAALVGALTPEEVAQVIVREALPALDASLGMVAVLSEDEAAFRTLGVVGYPPELESAWQTFPIDAPVPLADAVRRGEPLFLESEAERAQRYPHLADVRSAGGAGGLAAIPLLSEGQAIGGIVLVFRQPGVIDEEGRVFLLTLARLCAQALGRARLQALAQRNETQFRALADNITQLAWMADGSGSLFWYNRRWFDYTGTTFDEMQGWGWRAVHHPDHLARVEAKFRDHVERGQPWEDTFPLRGQDGLYRWFLSRASPIRNEAGDVILWFGTNTDITEQREAEAELAASYQREALLNRIGLAIRETRDPEQIQWVAVQALGEVLGVDRAYFNLLDMTRDVSWIGRDFRRADLPSLAGMYHLSEYQIEPVDYYPEGRTLVMPDVLTWEWPAPMREAIHSLRVRAAISVPLFDGGVLVGALAVAMADAPRVWTEAEISLVEATAVQTRAALDAARVQEREHRIAEQLQDALQPALPPHVPGLSVGKYTRPALDESEVGGDFFDVFPLDKELYAFIIGDVSGKGLAAAQQLALIRNSLRTTLYLSRAPAQAAASLNAIVTAHDLLVGFVTVFAGIYDAATGQISYASCGHEPALVRRADGAVEALPTTGPPLGVAENAAFEERQLTLAPNDSLLLYTDGISEAGPNRRELLGTDGLMRLLRVLPMDISVSAQVEWLAEQVSTFAHGIFRDDIAVLLARRR